MAQDPLLGRVLTDPATGLPNLPYFRMICDWEQRRAKRRNYRVRVLRVAVDGGDDRILRSLSWHLCRDLRTSDLIASEGSGHYRILLTSPDAENVEAIRQRLEDLVAELNDRYPSDRGLSVRVDVEPPPAERACGPCEPLDEQRFETSDEVPAISDDGHGPHQA